MSWLVMTVAVLAGGFLVSRLLKKALRVLLVLSLAVFAAGVIGGTAVCWEPPEDAAVEADYAVLLGCALEDGAPKEELIRRLELGLAWLQENEGKTLIVSGGDPQNQGVTEAQVMYDWLETHGADMSRVRKEEQANDTRQNLLFSKELAGQLGLNTDAVEILTSEYHQTRARYLAGQLGQTVGSLSCETPFLQHLEASVREVYAFLKAYLETR